MNVFRPIIIVLILSSILLAVSSGDGKHSAAYLSAENKFQFIGENGRRPNPSTRPTVLAAPEWNAYLNEGGVKLPPGVSQVRITSQPAVVHGDAEVDFDRLTANRTRSNPLLVLFTGKHHVTVKAQAAAANGIATVRVDSVALDGVRVPNFLLEYLCKRYLSPKYGPAVGMNSTFRLHNRIDTAIVGTDQVTITQR
ncbi:MAG: hypothetical protein CXZ00_09640 [Acidobacteria bacterium]|nr:MAG: hypothetical protein CXZ00_09640 [Acidobacteriota bacterium]